MQMQIPDDAIPFILYQRTQYLRLVRTLPYRALSRISPRSLYHHLVRLESRLWSDSIRKSYDDDMQAEYETVRPHLPATCSSVLDIGCGVAGFDTFIRNHYRAPFDLYLLDKTGADDKIHYDFESKASFYNSLDVARRLLRANGFAEERIHLIEVRPDMSIPIQGPVDVVVSLISWGFHYPVSTYLDRVHELLSPTGRLILDVRRGTSGRSEVAAKFAHCEVIDTKPAWERVVAWK